MRWERIHGMRKGIIVLLLFLGLSLLLPYYLPKENYAATKAVNNVFWTPGNISESLVPGETKELNVALSSSGSISSITAALTLWVTPELQPFVKRIVPPSLPDLSPGMQYPVRIVLYIPTDTKPGSFEGTFHLRLGSRTCPEVLKVSLNIIASHNIQPVANAGPDQTVAVGSTVTLDGSKSSDADDNPLTFKWSMTSVPSGSEAKLSNASAVGPTFVVDRPGAYVAQLIVNDGTVDSSPDMVTISTKNSKPVAEAGPDQTVYVQKTVTLDGGKSSDVDGDPLTFKWSMISSPSTSTAALANPASVNPTFVVDVPGIYVAQLAVNDGTVDSSPDTVTISTKNSKPIAEAGPDQTAYVGDPVTLNGSKSGDVDGDPLTFKWTMLSYPSNSQASLSDPTAVNPTFMVDQPGSYVAQLVVNDGTVNSGPGTVIITTLNSKPVAEAGPDQSALVGDTVTLDGSGSKDADGDPLTYRWSITTRPSDSSATLSDPTAVNPDFTIDRSGTYVVQLIVNDGTVDSSPDTVTISTKNSKPFANAGPDQPIYVGDTVTLNGSHSTDADGDPLTFRWSFTSVPQRSAAVLSRPGTSNPTFAADLPGSYIVQLIVNDGKVDSDPDTVSITAELRMVLVPAVTGSTQTAAEVAIVAAGLKVGAIDYAYSSNVSAAAVISQNPAAGASVAQSTAVNMVISLGPAMVTVPDVVGMARALAETAISAANLSVGTELEEHSPSVTADRVISQNPAAGASVAQSTAVNMVISLGPAMVTVPDVIGMARTLAETTISGTNLTVGSELQEYSDNVAAGCVINQSPAGGASVGTGTAVDLVISLGPVGGGLPPDPTLVAPPLDRTVATDIHTATRFLYTGTNPIQRGVSTATIEPRRVSVVRGKTMSRDGAPLGGVKVAVLNQPEYGHTLTRTDGIFDLAVNGGGSLTLTYEKQGYLPTQRQVRPPWQDYVLAPDVILIPLDTQVTTVHLNSEVPVQVARGSVVEDQDGARQATLFLRQGTQAEMVLPDGTRQALTSLSVRATEYTVGGNGPKAMPAALPPTSGYTYAVELSADEVIASGASDVHFSQPVYLYVENFLSFPTGMAVPSGYYDRARGLWVASEDGCIIKILGTSNGMADLDLNGDGASDDPASLAALGVTDAERQQLAALYLPDQSLWRIPVNHFTPYDYNWPFGPPPDAKSPGQEDPECDDETDSDCDSSGSIIECKNQVLGDTVSIVGTSFQLYYWSDRAIGRMGRYTMEIPLSGEVIPASLKRIDLEVSVAGRLFTESFPALPDQFKKFTWDGKDAYGRLLQGKQPATVRIGYVYDGVYDEPARVQASFALASGIPITASPARQEVTLWEEHSAVLGLFDAHALGNGGWSLDVHHVYDPVGKMLYMGDGRQQQADAKYDIITYLAGRGYGGFSGDNGPADLAQLNRPTDVVAGPDGSLYIADYYNYRVRRVSPDGIITTFAGNGNYDTSLPSGENGPATEAQIAPSSLATGPDGRLYILNWFPSCVYRIDGDGILRRVAGNPASAGCAYWNICDEGQQAVNASLNQPRGIAVGTDGSLYIAEYNFIRRVGLDGIIRTIVPRSKNIYPSRLAAGQDGSLYITDRSQTFIYQLKPDGNILTVAGNGTAGFSGDGGRAVDAMVNPTSLTVGLDGTIYFGDGFDFVNRIRRIGVDGLINTLAGGGTENFFDGGPAAAAKLSAYAISGLSQGYDGNLYAVQGNWLLRITKGNKAGAFGELAIPSGNGIEEYVFDLAGCHIRTVHALSKGLLREFQYNQNGKLIQVVDGYGNITSIERDESGNIKALVAPFGQRTGFGIDANGLLVTVTDPAEESFRMTYSNDGLLKSYTDRAGGVHTFDYDEAGRLISDRDPAGRIKTLGRAGSANGYEVTMYTALGGNTTYRTEKLPTGDKRSVYTFSDGTQNEVLTRTDGTLQSTDTSGTVTNQRLSPDPTWGMQTPLTRDLTVTTPQGFGFDLAEYVSRDPSAEYYTLYFNDRPYERDYDGDLKQYTYYTPESRIKTMTIDNQGQKLKEQAGDLLAKEYAYDTRGRLIGLSQGAGTDDVRIYNFTYDSQGYVESVTDPLGRVTIFAYDASGRVVSEILPGNRTVLFSYDANGNVISLTPPGKLAHTFTMTPVNLLFQYTPPAVDSGSTTNRYTYNNDSQLIQVMSPDGIAVDLGYDGSGRLTTITHAGGQTVYTYHATTGNLTGIAAPGGNTLVYTYDGSLLTGETWAGAVAGSVGYSYDNDFRISSTNINGGSAVSYQHDGDSLLTKAGDLSLSRNPQNGLITGTILGGVSDAFSYNGFGELTSYSASCIGTEVFGAQLSYDGLGRITRNIETILGTMDTYEYTYDLAGRLAFVGKNGTTTATYTYDGNGNRLSFTDPGGTVTGTYDDQDRLTQYGAVACLYTANGELRTKTIGSQTTQYTYDVFGNLTRVTLSGGIQVEYLIDGKDRRIGKKVNGAVIQGFIYQDALKPIAELDGNNVVVSRFVYGTGINVPDYMIKNGATYRIIRDHLGSPRLVLNVADGTIAQRMEYDEFGNVMTDTNPGFQPFGFAGGLYDHQTRLVRYGARDYDAETGRWTDKDPLLFSGGDFNLYNYAGGDPINYIDPSGLAHPGVMNLFGITDNRYEAAENFISPDGYYTVAGHGNPGGALSGGTRLTPNQLANKILNDPNYKPGMNILLTPCFTGKRDYARRLANILKTKVRAPTKKANWHWEWKTQFDEGGFAKEVWTSDVDYKSWPTFRPR
jgi:RHS repeat-associated protein